MVLLLAPSATVSVFECSTLAAAYSFAASPSNIDSTSLLVKWKLLDYLLPSKFLIGRLIRRGEKFPHKICAGAKSKKIASVFNFQLSELARKIGGPLAIAQSEKGLIFKKAVDYGLQTEGETGAVVKVFKVASDVPNNGAKWNQNIRQFLKSSPSSLDVPPQVPVPPFTGGLISLLGLVLVLGVILDRWIWRSSRRGQSQDGGNMQPEALGVPQLSSSGVAMFLRRDLRKKESVEWVNMVLGKLWKVYRLGLESWLVSLLQPLIDNLQKPAYVERVQIKQFYLGDEPISVRSVQRRASRRSNDLQYHIGLRYTGGARMLLLLKLKAGVLPIPIPVGVRGLDVEGELWVKLRLVPSQPWVGAATWAFVSLPKIKLDLSPFRLFNLMAIPFLSVFLTQLLTEDLPRLFVLPKKISLDFSKGPAPKDFKGATVESNKDFSGELSVMLVDARKLNYVPYSKTDPYVLLMLGDQLIKSKRNSQTSVFGPPGSPIWNQDFQLLVVDPESQSLTVRVQDYFGLTALTIGVGKVNLSDLQDTVPVDRLVRLTGGWGPFEKRFSGELLLRMTYTAYVEDEDEDEEREEGALLPSNGGYISESDENDADAAPFVKKVVNKAVDSVESEVSLSNVFAAMMAELDGEALGDTLVARGGSNGDALLGKNDEETEKAFGVQAGEAVDGRTALLLLGLVTGLLVLVDISINFSNFLNP